MQAGAPEMTLGDYIRQLIEALGAGEADGAERLRQIVGERVAVISVDAEKVLVRFEADRLHIETLARGAPLPRCDGVGETDRQTVLALLAGRIEATHAITSGRLRMRGTIDAVVRISQAIDILIDGAVRIPGLQALARAYRTDADHAPFTLEPPMDAARRRAELQEAERALLGRLGLLPDPQRDR
jgi:hypothetical protein